MGSKEGASCHLLHLPPPVGLVFPAVAASLFASEAVVTQGDLCGEQQQDKKLGFGRQRVNWSFQVLLRT